ncbi:hypothetical protein WJX75_008244 [Coccomyxa subellipsoidea]|uniref:Ubiquitin-like domain-containing protein n=1 Tax=Coccomyxa subellipsoidea TaxID=248742 RepID=A0ABR2Z4Q5_9CHLO
MAVRVQQSLPFYQDAVNDVQRSLPVRQLSVNEGSATKQCVRFQGETFSQLKERLLAAAVPGHNVRLLVDEVWTVLLDDEMLPEGDHLQIRTIDPGTDKSYAIVFKRKGCCLCDRQKHKQNVRK